VWFAKTKYAQISYALALLLSSASTAARGTQNDAAPRDDAVLALCANAFPFGRTAL
jgi:hypothetical protein